MKRTPWVPLSAVWAILALGILGLPACSEVTTVTTVEVASVEVMGESTAGLEETVQFQAVVRDASGAVLGGRVPTWTSGSPEVAAVDAAGRVEARSVGSAEIRATVEGVSGSRTITILAAPVMEIPEIPSGIVLFETSEGTTRVQSREIQISNGGGGALTGLTVETSGPSGSGPPSWLTATLDGTEAPVTLSVSVDPTGLPTGTYNGEVRLHAPSAANSPLIMPVRLQVGSPPPILEVSPEGVGFASSVGEPAPSSQTVQIRNAGGGVITGLQASVTYEAGGADGWLSAELSRNSTPAELRLEVDPAGLAPGAFEAQVTVSSSDTPQLSGEVSVQFRFGEPPPELDLSPTTLALEVEEGPASTPDALITVENRGGGTLENLSVQVIHESGSAQGWLTTSLESDSAPTRIRVGFSTANVLPGVHAAMIRVAAPDALNAPQDVPVELVVRPRASAEHSTFTVDPTSLTADGTSTAILEVRLFDARSDPIPFGGDDVSFSTTAGTLSAVTDLGTGRYRATLTAPTSPGEAQVSAFLRGQQVGGPVEVAFPPEDPPDDDPPGDDPPGDDPPDDDPPGDDPPGDDPPDDDPPGDDPPGDDPPDDDPPEDDPPEDDPPEEDPSSDPSAAHSSIQASPDSILADGESESVVTVTLFDASGDRITVGGDNVQVRTDLGTISATLDQGDGSYVATLTAGTESGTATLSATLNGEVIADGAQVAFLAPDPSEPSEPSEPSATRSTLTAGSSPATPGSSAQLTVQVRNAAGENMGAGIRVFLTTDRGNLDSTGGTTDANGRFMSGLRASGGGTATVTAYLGSDASGEVIGSVQVRIAAGGS
jgi:hypothetical protein